MTLTWTVNRMERSATLDQPTLERWGRDVGSALATGALPRPLVVALRGPLGAGKSVLARAVARGAGVASPMPSPTYNLLFRYEVEETGVVVQHLDLYRLDDPDDVWELGWQELGEADEIVLIEWPERAEALLPADRWEVRLELPDDDASVRTVHVDARGSAPAPPTLPESVGSGAGPAGSARSSS